MGAQYVELVYGLGAHGSDKCEAERGTSEDSFIHRETGCRRCQGPDGGHLTTLMEEYIYRQSEYGDKKAPLFYRSKGALISNIIDNK